MRYYLLSLLLLFASVSLLAQTSAPSSAVVSLPAPAKTGGMSLTQALATRRSVRSYSGTALTQQELSQLLWATQGITDDKGHRTAPSAHANYFLHIYVATADGLAEYVPDGHKLKKLSSKDIRAKVSQQPQTSAAPAVFIITGDNARPGQGPSPDVATRWVDLEAGHATQNLLLQAIALSLAGVPMGGFDPDALAKLISLPESIRAIYLVPVGHPK